MRSPAVMSSSANSPANCDRACSLRCSAGSAARHVEANLEHLTDIAGQFEQAASTKPLFQLWWVVSALLEVLRDGGIDTSVSIKRLLGHVDRELRRLQDQGETRYADEPAGRPDQQSALLPGPCPSAGPRVSAVRKSFALHEVMNADSDQ